MCGIAGVFVFNQPTRGRSYLGAIESMVGAMRHRGPDNLGLKSSSDMRCIFGHARLSIVDHDVNSNQPFESSDRQVMLVFNGEVYNHQEIKRGLELRGYIFKTHSDTEVVLNAYLEYGAKMFAQLDGMFSLAIHDARTDQLLLARDRAGEKPLYYSRRGGRVLFSSELRPMVEFGDCEPSISLASLYDYFSMRYVSSPNTIIDEVLEVQPSTYMVFGATGLCSEHSYFSYEIPVSQGSIAVDDYVDKLHDAIEESVLARLQADVPVGIFLSSGVDSSLVASIAGGLTKGLKAFCVGFEYSGENECVVAREIADYIGLDFRSYVVSEQDVVDVARNIGGILDFPNGDRSCVPTYLLSKVAASETRVALSGDGGDELFAGYGRYDLAMPAVTAGLSAMDRVLNYLSVGLPVFDHEALQGLMPDQYAVFRSRVLSKMSIPMRRDDLATADRLRLIDFHSYLPQAVLAKVDRMSMQHSLEVRAPLLGSEILQISRTQPKALQRKNGVGKLPLRHVLSRLLPDKLVSNRKSGFGMPGGFMASHSSHFEKMLTEADEAISGLLVDTQLFLGLRLESRRNINSVWAWIVLGQWLASLRVRAYLVD